MILSHAQIKRFLPHRYPMLLVDYVVSIEPGQRIVARKNVTGNEGCFSYLTDTADAQSHAYPSVLIIESFCQVAGILSMWSHYQGSSAPATDRIVLFGAIAGCRFLDANIFPGDTLEHRVHVERDLGESAICGGSVWVGERQVAQIEQIVAVYRPANALAGAAQE
ncbi:MAG: 3-hydroxyacyl-ACP dehydratase FabZ family protein [Acidiferrobacterales bacterium]